MLRLVAPMDSGGRYGFSIRGVRNVTGVSADVNGVFVAPEPRAVAAPVIDTLLRPDSLRTFPDSQPGVMPRPQ